MKKLILTITVLTSLSAGALAQSPDLHFETWGAAAPPFVTVQDPVGWASLNALTAVGTDTSVFKQTISPGGGLASAKIRTVKVMGASIPNPYTSGNIDTAGILVMGKINASPPGLSYGKPYFGRPATLGFVSKYTPMAGDSAFVLAYLTHWNGVKRDTIATGKYATGTSTTVWAAHFVTMVYKPAFSSVWADTMLVFASSSVYNHVGAKIGSTFYLDEMSWSGFTGTNDINGVDNKTSVFPNPATNVVNFTSTVKADAVEILDISGRKVGAYMMTGNNVSIPTFGFAPGFYLYNVVNEKKEIVGRGKFEIAK